MTLSVNNHPPIWLHHLGLFMLLLGLMSPHVRLKDLQVKKPTPNKRKPEEKA
jgi:hypothetical protein